VTKRGFDALRCFFERDLRPEACRTDVVPARIYQLFGRARTLVDRAASAGPAQRERLLGGVAGALGRARKLIDRSARGGRHPLSAACAEALRATTTEALGRVDASR
jgi:hypothetical protein